MRTYLECYPCFLRQALDAAQLAGADADQQKALLDEVLGVPRGVELSSTPPEIGSEIHRLVRRKCGNGDPNRALKEANTRLALALFPQLSGLVQEANDPLGVAVRLSIAGNIFDVAPGQPYDLWAVIERVLAQPFAVDDRVSFQEALGGADQVLYLADNAGETAFDRLLIEALNVPVVYAVKGGAVLNDATLENALASGLGHVADLVDTGSDAPGTILDCCSREFRRLLDQVEMVIAKGQANYETLSEAGPKVFFLLQTKCPVIARDVGVAVGSIVLKQGPRRDVTTED